MYSALFFQMHLDWRRYTRNLELTHIFPASDYKILQGIGLDIIDAYNGIALRSVIHRLFDAHL